MDTLRRGLELHRNLWRLKGMTGALLIKSKVGWSLPNPPGGLS